MNTESNKQILVIDDDETITNVLKITLEQKGCSGIVIEHDGDKAIAGIQILEGQGQEFETIITDNDLGPSFLNKGLEVVAAARKVSERTVIIFMSGKLDLALEKKARDAGADAVVSKPFRLAEILATIHTAACARVAYKEATD